MQRLPFSGDSRMTTDNQTPGAEYAGAAAFDSLLAGLADLANETCGDDGDGINYGAAAARIEAAIAAHVAGADAGHAAGFLRGLADVLVTASLGNSIGAGWRAADLQAQQGIAGRA